MALLKQQSGYGGAFEIDLGQEVEDVQKEQLQVSSAEILKAINQENLTDRIFGRVLRNRTKSHEQLLAAVPGATQQA